MVIKTLDWDSLHFNTRIGSVQTAHLTQDQFEFIEKQSDNYDLVYAFSNSYDVALTKPINTKVYYLAHHSELKHIHSNHISEISNNQFDRIYDLSIVAGQHSRFKLDPLFDPKAYEMLYTKWVEKSFSPNHIVFGYIKDQTILGMISLKFDSFSSVANIELIGVDPDAQGMQVGTKLISACVNYTKQNSNMNYLSVQTQKENSLACKFYNKCGFKEQNSVNIHHIWTK